jgi:hypothetical protein
MSGLRLPRERITYAHTCLPPLLRSELGAKVEQTDADTRDLEALNRQLGAWIEEEYHYAPHRGLDWATPIDCWAAGSAYIQLPTSDLRDVSTPDPGMPRQNVRVEATR